MSTASELEISNAQRDRARATLTKIRGIIVANSKGIGSYESAMSAIASILHVRAPRRPR